MGPWKKRSYKVRQGVPAPPRKPREPRNCTIPSQCRACSAPMLWCVWPSSGKKMPVDAAPVADGNIVITIHGGTGGELRCEKYRENEPTHQNRNRYTSHFATCPESAELKKKADDRTPIIPHGELPL